jgi:hypothetical protein
MQEGFQPLRRAIPKLQAPDPGPGSRGPDNGSLLTYAESPRRWWRGLFGVPSDCRFAAFGSVGLSCYGVASPAGTGAWPEAY